MIEQILITLAILLKAIAIDQMVMAVVAEFEEQ